MAKTKKLVKKKINQKAKLKKRTRPAKSAVKKLTSPLKKKSYCEKSFAPNLKNIEAPQLITKVATQQIDKKKFLVVSVVHPNTQKILKEVRLPVKTDLNKAFELGKSLKDELSKTVKTWVRGSEDDPEYEQTKKETK